MFDYQEFVSRNIGFVTESEQERLRTAKVLVIGVGGMGGTALACLARSGIENFMITDIDTFEVSNLNRQIFAKVSVVGCEKVQVARDEILAVNPGINCEIIQGDWRLLLDQIFPRVDVVLNGCDDVRATVHLMRKAKEHGKTVIDAFASTLPNVYVVGPNDPRPEEFMKFPTVGRDPKDLTDTEVLTCAGLETEYVLVHSSTASHVVLEKAAEMVTGKRKRISFAPMVWMTGTLMAYEVIKVILKEKSQVSYTGVFYNPYTMKVETALNPVSAILKRSLVRAFLNKMKGEA